MGRVGGGGWVGGGEGGPEGGSSATEAWHQGMKGKEKVTGVLGCLEPSELSSEVTKSPSGCRVSPREVIHILMEGTGQNTEQLSPLLSV